jgi:hypothetical protein
LVSDPYNTPVNPDPKNRGNPKPEIPFDLKKGGIAFRRAIGHEYLPGKGWTLDSHPAAKEGETYEIYKDCIEIGLPIE